MEKPEKSTRETQSGSETLNETVELASNKIVEMVVN